VPLDPTLLSDCTGTNPIKCTIPVAANGDYTITVALGDATTASVARVQAELYRIVVPQVALAAGPPSLATFSANVRAEMHDGYSAPGMILDLLIDAPTTGPAPRLAGLGVAAAPTIPTIFVAGDSTVCDWDPALATILDPSERGWAQELSQFLEPGVAVANYADSGETAATFYTKFFPQARSAMRAGDYLFIQFGHNDQKSSTDIANYQSNLMKYITDARAKNVTPVLFTPVARKTATTADPGFAGLDQQARDLAAAQGVALVDLTTLAIAYYKTVPNLSALFATPTEATHFSESGATQIANLVAVALKAGSLPLASLVK
jgi:lysophospholipase L1-like esterase